MKFGCSEVPKPTYPSLLWPAEWKAPAPLSEVNRMLSGIGRVYSELKGMYSEYSQHDVRSSKVIWCATSGGHESPIQHDRPFIWRNVCMTQLHGNRNKNTGHKLFFTYLRHHVIFLMPHVNEIPVCVSSCNCYFASCECVSWFCFIM